MSQIFLSYSRKDARFADRLVKAVEARGHSVWMDRSAIRGGKQWREEIVKAIDGCRYFVLLVSPRSVSSDNVRKELDLADECGKTVIPAIAADTEIPEGFRWQTAGVQRIDFAGHFDAGLAGLLAAVGVEQETTHRPPRRLWRFAAAGIAAVAAALLAARIAAPGDATAAGGESVLQAGGALSASLKLWEASQVFLLLAVLLLAAALFARRFSRLQPGSLPELIDAHPVAAGLAIYLLLVLPGTMALGIYPGAIVALLAAALTGAVLTRTGRELSFRSTALVLALTPVVPVVAADAWHRAGSVEVEKVARFVAPSFEAGNPNRSIAGSEPAGGSEVVDEDLKALSERFRETLAAVFGAVKKVEPEQFDTEWGFDDARLTTLQGDETATLLLQNTAEFWRRCSDADDRAYYFEAVPWLLHSDRQDKLPSTGERVCRSEIDYAFLRAAMRLLTEARSRPELRLTETEESRVKEQLLREWWTKTLFRANAIANSRDGLDRVAFNEADEKARVASVFEATDWPPIFETFAFLWRDDTARVFPDSDVLLVLGQTPGRSAGLAGREAVAENFSSLHRAFR